MPEGSNAAAILLMLALMLGGCIILFNWIPALNIGFSDINNFGTGIWIVVAKLVGLSLIVLGGWVIFNIIRS